MASAPQPRPGTVTSTPASSVSHGLSTVVRTGLTTFQPGGTSAASGPDYESLYRDASAQAAYEAKKARGGFNAWDRERGKVKRNGKTFLEMMTERFPSTARKFNSRKIEDITAEQLAKSAVVFAQKGELDKLRWCVDLGVDLAYVSIKNKTALETAAIFGQVEVVSYLVQEVRLNPNKRNGKLPICGAGIAGCWNTIKLLIDNGAWLSGVTEEGNTVLHWLLLGEKFQAVSHLLDYLEERASRHTCQQFKFDQIGYWEQTVLSVAIHLLCNAHTKFFREMPALTTAEIRQQYRSDLNAVLLPLINIVKRLRALSGQAYGQAISDARGRCSKVPCHFYATTELAKREGYIEDLYLADEAFVKKIIADIHQHRGPQDCEDFLAVAETVVSRYERAAVFHVS